MATHPFSADDLALMLRSGFSSPEIIEAVGEKQLVSEMGPQQVATLRAQGADKQTVKLPAIPAFVRRTANSFQAGRHSTGPDADLISSRGISGKPDRVHRNRPCSEGPRNLSSQGAH